MNTINPFKGLNTYQESDSELFFGRRAETRALSEQIFTRKSTIITGASGSGKSSLINAGLIPTLKGNGYIPVKITPNLIIHEDIVEIWSALSELLIQVINENNLKYLAKPNALKDFNSCSLSEKLNYFDYLDEFGFEVSFVFIIDQFEEIFQRHFNLKSISQFFSSYQGICVNKFNEQSYYCDEDASKAISTSSISRENNHKFVISIRQDYLFEIDKYSVTFPLLQQNRFHLSKLNEEQAYEIITMPRKADGTPWFSEDDATAILQNLLETDDFIRDGIPEQEVDAMLLSIYLYQTVDAFLKQKNIILGNADEILTDFYNERMQISGIELLEERLVSENGLYRQSISYGDALNYISRDTIKHLENEGIFNISYRNKNTYVELHHDRLCSCAKEHIVICRIKSTNQRRFDASAYLSMKYRVLHENSYWFLSHGYSEYTSHVKWKSFIIQRFKEISAGKPGDYTSLFRDTSNAHSYSAILKFSSKHGDGDQTTFDGISQFELKYVHGLLYSLFFKDIKGAPVSIYTGISHINFYYDDKNRIYLIEYKDVHGQKQIVQDGYSAILYEYADNNSKLPDRTYYLDLPADFKYLSQRSTDFYKQLKSYIVQHREGNWGYRSKYNIYGCEIERTFIDQFDIECNTFEGFSRICFEKSEDDEILSIAYYSMQTPVLNAEKVHKVVFTYQKGVDGYESRYYDIEIKPCKMFDGTYGCNVFIDYKNSEFKLSYIGKDDNLIENNEGILYQINKFDNKYNITQIINFNSKNEVHSRYRMVHTNSGLCKLIESRLIEDNNITYIDYDEKSRIVLQTWITSQFNVLVAKYAYENNGDYSIMLYKDSNYTESATNKTIWIKNRGLQRIEQWDEQLFLKMNFPKDEEFSGGYICNSEGEIAIDPDYGASEVQQTKDSKGTIVRTFFNNGIAVRKEFLRDEEVTKIEILHRGEWKKWEVSGENYMIWSLDSSRRPIKGDICLKDGSPINDYDGPFDSITTEYCNESIIRTFYKHNIVVKKQVYNTDELLIKEYEYIQNEINYKCVKYFINGESDYYELFDESEEGRIMPIDYNGYHKYINIRNTDDDGGVDYDRVGYFNSDNTSANGPEGWAMRTIARQTDGSALQIIVYCTDEEENFCNGPLEFFGLYGSYLELYYLRSFLIKYTLKKRSRESNKVHVENEVLKRLSFLKKRAFINSVLKPKFNGLIDFKNCKIQIYKLSPVVTKLNASEKNIEADESYFVTANDGFKGIIFVKGETYIHYIIHYGENQFTRSAISVLYATHPNILTNDIIIQFGNWNYFDYNIMDSADMESSFEEEFKYRTSNCESTKILLARKNEEEWQCYRGIIKFDKGRAKIGKLGAIYLPTKDVSEIEKSTNDFIGEYPDLNDENEI